MWTPRRIVLLLLGFLGSLTGYVAYGRSFLGAIDGLPGLPSEYLRVRPGTIIDPRPNKTVKPVEEKLKQAFGDECPELKRQIKLELHSRNMVLAADVCQPEDDGRVKLTPISVAMFGKDKGDGRFPEINTIQGKVAKLKFDRPVTTLSDISGRKLLEAELTGDIKVFNNRHTPDRYDDLCLYIGTGPLYFSEEKHLIWTTDHVHVKDFQSRPPNEVLGTGMDLELLTEAAPAKPGMAHKQKQESITGVKRIILRSDVVMFLYTDAKSGFPGNAHEAPAPQLGPGTAPPPRAKITITTPGRFTYDFGKEKEPDLASFELPAFDPNQELRGPQEVHVVRVQPGVNGMDQLVCQKLVLHLRRGNPDEKKPEAPPPPASSSSEQLVIERAHATGTEVLLTSDTESLDAHCVELIHDKRNGVTVTTLRGNPQMRAVKDGNVIHAQEVEIKEIPPADKKDPKAKPVQLVKARGPGQIDILDKVKKKRNQHAIWKDLLTTSRDGDYDLLVLTGDAKFLDDEKEEYLQAQVLKVWLEDKPPPDARAKPTPAVATGPQPPTPPEKAEQGQSNRRPHHLEALENVRAQSAEMLLHDTGRLVVWFEDAPNEALLLAPPRPANPAASSPAPLPGGGLADSPPFPETRPALLPGPAPATAPPGQAGHPDKKEPPRPIDLSARQVDAWVLRSEIKGNTLKKLESEGKVHVQQEPAKPEEKGVDIEGDRLQLFNLLDPQTAPSSDGRMDGYKLVVMGDVAKVRMDKIYILGPEVQIDQVANTVWVPGVGAMLLDSDRSFSGNNLKKSEPLEIHWNKSMFLQGKHAEFEEGIQAEQGKDHLTCQYMQVFFDRPISLKQGNSREKPPRVETLVCDHSVRICEETWEDGRLVKFQQIEGTAVEVYSLPSDEPDGRPRVTVGDTPRSEVNQLKASGPGTVRIFQPGSSDPLAAPANGQPGQPGGGPNQQARQGQQGQQQAKPGAKPNEEAMKLTYVTFTKNMAADNRSNKANFWGNVRVLNMPSDNPQKQIDLDSLLERLPKEGPKEAFYLSCEQLMVLTRKENGVSSQEMEARRRVVVQAKEFWGRCDLLTFNEAKDQIIFHGTDSEPATLFRQLTVGGKVDEIKGKKIIYIRSSGDFNVDGAGWISGH